MLPDTRRPSQSYFWTGLVVLVSGSRFQEGGRDWWKLSLRRAGFGMSVKIRVEPKYSVGLAAGE